MRDFVVGFFRFLVYGTYSRLFVLFQDPIERIENDVVFLPWAKGMKELGFTGSV